MKYALWVLAAGIAAVLIFLWLPWFCQRAEEKPWPHPIWWDAKVESHYTFEGFDAPCQGMVVVLSTGERVLLVYAPRSNAISLCLLPPVKP